MPTDRLKEIKETLAAATPGPWRWGGDLRTRHVYLATRHHGRVMVMTFDRWGMQGAAPTFWDHSAYDVALGWGGRPQRTADCAVREQEYRGDIDRIDNPDAALIAAAPELLAWAAAEIERLRTENERLTTHPPMAATVAALAFGDPDGELLGDAELSLDG